MGINRGSSLCKTIKAIRVEVGDKNVVSKIIDEVLVREHTLYIIVNGVELGEYVLSPSGLEDFIYGNLFALGVIDGVNDIVELKLLDSKAIVHLRSKPKVMDKLKLLASKHLVSSSCFSSVHSVEEQNLENIMVNSNITIPAKQVIEYMGSFLKESKTFKITGGVHSAALFNLENPEPSIFVEDIGRHNTVDKAIGRGLLEGVDFSKMILTVSGRISSDLLLKAVRAGIPVIISKSPPTYEAVSFARKTRATIIGFARGTRFNVYSHPQRIKELHSIDLVN